MACAEALELDPDNLHLRLLRARALIALRWLDEAREELASCARLDPSASVVYRLLGEVALRSDRADAAVVFLREALRLDASDAEAREWLGIAESLLRTAARPPAAPPPPVRPITAAEKLPAAAAVMGHFARPHAAPPALRPSTPAENIPAAAGVEGPFSRRRLPARPPALRPSTPAENIPAAAGVEGPFPRRRPPASPPAFRPSPPAEHIPAAAGVEGPLSRRRPAASASPFRPSTPAEQIPAAAGVEGRPLLDGARPRRSPLPVAAADSYPAAAAATGALVGRASSPPPGEPRATSSARALGTASGAPLPLASGFGNYLVEIGVLTEPQLRAALAYKRATGVRLGRAVTTLGFATELKIEWASLAYHGRHQRGGERSVWDGEPTPPEHRRAS